MTVDLAGVANAQFLTVTLSNVTDQFSQTLPNTNVERVRSEKGFPVRNIVSLSRRGTAFRFSVKRPTADPFVVCGFAVA